MSVAVDIAVVGAGPAGLAAAAEAARLGLNVLVLDEGIVPGGQYFRQPRVPMPAGERSRASRQTQAGAARVEEARQAGATIWSQATVWGVFPGLRLAVEHGDAGREVVARRLILATGAHDRTLAFPGWTLPGVMTPGAAQALAKGERVLVGRRVVIAGSGPFLLVVAAQLLDMGAVIVAVVESARWQWGSFADLLRYPGRCSELLRYLLPLWRAGVPIRVGHAVITAHGESHIEAVTIAELDSAGRPRSSSAQTIAADVLAVAHGFRISGELAGIAGCAQEYDEQRGGRYCRVDPGTGETSVAGIYAAGEITGFAGAGVALAEGRIAGLSAARSLAAWNGEAQRRLIQARRLRRREQAFADLVNRTFAPPPGLTAIVTDETLVCRCEEVRACSIRAAVAAGAQTATAVKMWTRCGMGRCQGRICSWTVGRYVAALTGRTPAEVGVNEPRIPARPIRLGAVLAALDA